MQKNKLTPSFPLPFACRNSQKVEVVIQNLWNFWFNAFVNFWLNVFQVFLI